MTTGKYINPLTDFGFKKLFGSEPNKALLIGFLLDPVYSIGILDFIFDDSKNDLDPIHVVELKDQNCKVFFEKLRFVYIELPKFKKTEKELKTQIDKWLYVFTHLAELNSRPKALRDRVFQRLFEAAEIAKFTPTEQKAYEESLKYYRDMKNVVDTAHEEGREEGRVEGREEGRVEGREEGREEERFTIARALNENGVSVDLIMNSTGLTREEVERL